MSATPPIRITLQILHDTLAAVPPSVRENKATDSFLLASAILKHYFSLEWLEANLNNPGFLQIIETDQNSKDLSALRMIDLAEVIYNLQHVPGFDDCIARMEAGHIEDTFAELDLGRMLFLNSVPFRYVVPQGVKGKDYDVEVMYPDGTIACADAKCALEKSDLRAKSIANKLEKARKQLPADRPGIIFVKTPPKWLEQSDFISMIVNESKALFARSQRIVSVKFYTSPNSVGGGYIKQEHAFKELSNPVTRSGASRNWNLFRRFDLPPGANGMPTHWQRVLFFPDGKVPVQV
jgi:hypothetical protein